MGSKWKVWDLSLSARGDITMKSQRSLFWAVSSLINVPLRLWFSQELGQKFTKLRSPKLFSVEDRDKLTSQLQPCSDSLVEEPVEIQLQRLLTFVISLIISPNTVKWGNFF